MSIRSCLQRKEAVFAGVRRCSTGGLSQLPNTRYTMLKTADIALQLKNILNDRFGIEPAELNENSRLGDFGIDSLHLVDVMLDVETALGIKLDDLSLPPTPSLGEVTAAISRNLAKTI